MVRSGWVGGWFLSGNKATLWLHLASWNLPDYQSSWKSKMEPSVALMLLCGSILQAGTCKISSRAENPRQRGTLHLLSWCGEQLRCGIKHILGEGGHCTYFVVSRGGGNNWGGDTTQLSCIIKIPTKPSKKFVNYYQLSKWWGWVDGYLQDIMPLRSSNLQAWTCQIFSLTEISRWSRA